VYKLWIRDTEYTRYSYENTNKVFSVHFSVEEKDGDDEDENWTGI